MRLLLGTHLLLWAAGDPNRLSTQARAIVGEPDNQLHLSVASICEIAIKRGLGRNDFQIEPRLLRRGLLDNGYGELSILSAHAIALDHLPDIHKDPFDRMLIAQAMTEGMILLTSDDKVSQYGGPIRRL